MQVTTGRHVLTKLNCEEKVYTSDFLFSISNNTMFLVPKKMDFKADQSDLVFGLFSPFLSPLL